jgi:hypothetical protein
MAKITISESMQTIAGRDQVVADTPTRRSRGARPSTAISGETYGDVT